MSTMAHVDDLRVIANRTILAAEMEQQETRARGLDAIRIGSLVRFLWKLDVALLVSLRIPAVIVAFAVIVIGNLAKHSH